MNERLSAVRIVDDTLEEFGLPGFRDVLPFPQEFLSETLGVPSPNDLVESLKERVRGDVRTRAPRPPMPPFPRY